MECLFFSLQTQKCEKGFDVHLVHPIMGLGYEWSLQSERLETFYVLW